MVLVLALASVAGCGARSGPGAAAGGKAEPSASSVRPSPAASTGAVYDVVPVGVSSTSDSWVLDRIRAEAPPKGYPRPTAADLLVLDASEDGYADAAWMPDSSRLCLASLHPATGQFPSTITTACEGVPALATGDGPTMFGPVNFTMNSRGLDWFAVLAGSDEPLALVDAQGQGLGPLHQRSAVAANGMVYTVAAYYFLGGTVVPGSQVATGEPRLCTRSRAQCTDALGTATYTFPSPSS